jgi:hypothetical protein
MAFKLLSRGLRLTSEIDFNRDAAPESMGAIPVNSRLALPYISPLLGSSSSQSIGE